MSEQEISRAYIAGLVDGEGSIYVTVERTESVTGFRIRPRFRLAMKRDDDTRKVRSVLGEYCEWNDVRYSITNRANGYSWKFEVSSDENVTAFLEPLMPHLVIKRDRAEIVVQEGWTFPRGTGAMSEEEKKEKMIHLMEKREQIRGMSADRDSKYDVATVKEEIYNE